MLNISEIVKKTEEMFDLFNQHFYSNELTRPASQYPHGWPVLSFLLFRKKKISLKKGLLSHQKCVSCHSQGKQPIQKISK